MKILLDGKKPVSGFDRIREKKWLVGRDGGFWTENRFSENRNRFLKNRFFFDSVLTEKPVFSRMRTKQETGFPKKKTNPHARLPMPSVSPLSRWREWRWRRGRAGGGGGGVRRGGAGLRPPPGGGGAAAGGSCPHLPDPLRGRVRQPHLQGKEQHHLLVDNTQQSTSDFLTIL